MGAISLGCAPDGKRIRRKVSGKTKQEVRAKLQALRQELNSGVRSSSTYTVREAVDDWLRDGLDGTSDRTRTLYEGLLGPVLDAIGARPLRVLSAGDVRSALSQLATRYSTRSLQITRNSLERAIRHAESNDLVGRNVAGLVKAPQGRSGRPSKSFTLEQAKALLAASEGTRLHAYVVLSCWSASAPRKPGRCAGTTWSPGWMIRPDGNRLPALDSIRPGRAKAASRSRRASAMTGRRGSSGTPSCRSCPPAACPWRASPCWSVTTAQPPPNRFTATKSAPPSSRLPR
jgi:hypothetical protein